ncbi:MAG: VOC family protein [Planctomycetota bacterium]|jgi:lactoylglutathione lyase|nr:VOC family protein [Planctomycetota bacterium]
MRIAHTMIRVKDLEESVRFYTEFLGLQELRRRRIGEDATLVFLSDETQSHQIELTYNHEETDYKLGNQFGHLAFTTPDLEPLIANLSLRDCWYRRSRPESNSKYIFIKDPNGYDIEIIERSS